MLCAKLKSIFAKIINTEQNPDKIFTGTAQNSCGMEQIRHGMASFTDGMNPFCHGRSPFLKE